MAINCTLLHYTVPGDILMVHLWVWPIQNKWKYSDLSRNPWCSLFQQAQLKIKNAHLFLLSINFSLIFSIVISNSALAWMKSAVCQQSIVLLPCTVFWIKASGREQALVRFGDKYQLSWDIVCSRSTIVLQKGTHNRFAKIKRLCVRRNVHVLEIRAFAVEVISKPISRVATVTLVNAFLIETI